MLPGERKGVNSSNSADFDRRVSRGVYNQPICTNVLTSKLNPLTAAFMIRYQIHIFICFCYFLSISIQIVLSFKLCTPYMCVPVKTQQAAPSQRPSESPLTESEGNGVTTCMNSSIQNQNSVIQINDNDDPKSLLQNLRAKNRDRPIIAHLNINFLDPKFDPLQDIIKKQC